MITGVRAGAVFRLRRSSFYRGSTIFGEKRRLFMGGLANKFLAMLVLLLCLSCATFSQNITATLTGTVTDSSGAAVAGAAVTLHNNGTNADVHTTTDQTGAYTVPDLPVGTYTITFKANG